MHNSIHIWTHIARQCPKKNPKEKLDNWERNFIMLTEKNSRILQHYLQQQEICTNAYKFVPNWCTGCTASNSNLDASKNMPNQHQTTYKQYNPTITSHMRLYKHDHTLLYGQQAPRFLCPSFLGSCALFPLNTSLPLSSSLSSLQNFSSLKICVSPLSLGLFFNLINESSPSSSQGSRLDLGLARSMVVN